MIAENFRVAELRVRHVKIRSKSCFAELCLKKDTHCSFSWSSRWFLIFVSYKSICTMCAAATIVVYRQVGSVLIQTRPDCCCLKNWVFPLHLETTTDYGCPMKSFLYNTQIVRYLGFFGQFYSHKFCHCPFLVQYFASIGHFFYKWLRFSYILKEYIFGFGVLVLAVKNFGSRHHASIVRGDNSTFSCKLLPIGIANCQILVTRQ